MEFFAGMAVGTILGYYVEVSPEAVVVLAIAMIALLILSLWITWLQGLVAFIAGIIIGLGIGKGAKKL